jgi:hypothetical protein
METKQCRKCKCEKSLTEFSTVKNKPINICKMCASENAIEWQKKLSESTDPTSMLENTFYKMLQATRSNAKKDNRIFELSLPVLRSIYDKQQGKCYYTGVPMTLRSNGHLNRDPMLISMDRKDSAQGYTPTNTVLCCWGINALKGHHNELTLFTTLKTLYDGAHSLGKL